MSVPVFNQKQIVNGEQLLIKQAADQAHEEAMQAEAMGDRGVTFDELSLMMQAAVARGEEKRLSHL